jgi:uncharacterized membrane protein (DUF106 family)
MTNLPAELFSLINIITNAVLGSVLSIIAVLPGWLSNTIISAVTGVLLLIIFKYTSNQRAIGHVRDNIKANMLALRLFKDEIAVTLQSQGRVFRGALQLLFHSLRPMLVMILPVSLLLAQMGLWYQFRPLLLGEEALVTLKLANSELSRRASGNPMPEAKFLPHPGIAVTIGPVRVPSKNEIYWQIKPLSEGKQQLAFQLENQTFEKQVAVGRGFMRISAVRPGPHWSDILLHPAEKPFTPESPVYSISVEYPERSSWTSGSDWWIVYFFIASMAFALLFKPFLKVRI